VTTVEIKDVEIPEAMQRAMARQAEAERERRAKIISAEGEFQASQKLYEASEVLSRNPAAMQLRYQQTLVELGGDKSTVVFPLPMDLLAPFLPRGGWREAADVDDEVDARVSQQRGPRRAVQRAVADGEKAGRMPAVGHVSYRPGMDFRTVVELGGKTATGMQVPDEVVSALGAGQRPAVRVLVGGHTYRTTVASMGGRFLVSLSAENRTAAGVSAGQEVDVSIEADAAPREVTVPADLADALAGDHDAQAFFDALAYSHRKEWVRWIEAAKRVETRTARVSTTLASLRAGKRTR